MQLIAVARSFYIPHVVEQATNKYEDVTKYYQINGLWPRNFFYTL